MNKSILLLSTQYPSYGGAATLVYKLHRTLIDNSVNSYCIFLNSRNIKKELYNPDNINNVYHSLLISDYNDSKICQFYEDIEKLKLNPDIVIGFNYIAPIIGKKIFPTTTVCYYITGCKYLSDTDMSAYQYLNNKDRSSSEQNMDELYCMNLVDLIIPNSYVTKNTMTKIYPSISHKLTDVVTFEEIFFNIKQNLENSDKRYDIAVVSSRFDRGVKNINFIKHLFDDPRLAKYSKICIGRGSEGVINADHHFGFVGSNQVDDILSKTKLVLICSRFESLSITLIQSLNNNCIVLSNQNIGGSIYLDKFYILHHFCSETWINKITNILGNYSYHFKLFKPFVEEFNLLEKVKYLLSIKNESQSLLNVIFVTVDKPYEGGSSNNLLNIIKIFREKSRLIKPIGLFIVNDLNGVDIDKYELEDLYFIKLDKNIEVNLESTISVIETKYGEVSMYFIKNYKAVTCFLKKIDSSKIIFSPSGLRMVSSLQNYYNKMSNDELIKHRIQNISFDDSMELFDFIKKYDTNLELYVFEKLKYVVPNSLLTYNLIKTIYQLDYRLLPPINLTYIDYLEQLVENNNINDRQYDLAFVSFNWKRNVKNFDFINRLLEKMDRRDSLNILIIGDNQKLKMSLSNITTIKHVEHYKLLELFKQIKVICMNSYYDSSPNTLKESLQQGCQILITENIGNCNYFKDDNIINEPDDIDLWISKIYYLLDNISSLPCPLKISIDSNQIFYTLENLLLSKISEQNVKLISTCDSVGFHRLPNEWSVINTIEDIPVDSTGCVDMYKNLHEYDLFFQYFTNQFNEHYTKSNYKYHFCIADNDCNGDNSKVSYFKGINYLPYMRDNVYLWRISKSEHLNLFRNCNKYFFRGNYYKLFNDIAPDKHKTLYCATSLFYDKSFNIVTNATIPYKFDKLLAEEDNIDKVKLKFPNSDVVKYLKRVTGNFISHNLKRDIDYLFVASEKQITKNRKIFVDFVMYCEKNMIKTTFCNIGKHDEYYNENINKDSLRYVNYLQYDNLSSSHLIEIYNRSRINLIFSGRDALPRVTIESLGCGCYNIALDTLTDGKFLYREPMGVLLSFPNLQKEYQVKTKSISYSSNNKIFDELIKFKDINYSHDKISLFYFNYINYYNSIKVMENILVVSELADYLSAVKTHYSLTKGFEFAKGLANNNKKVYYLTTGETTEYENISLINVSEIGEVFIKNINYIILIRETNLTELMNKSEVLKSVFMDKKNVKIAIKCDNIDWLLSKDYINYFGNDNKKWINFVINCFDMICCQTEELKATGLAKINNIYQKDIEICQKLESRIFISRMGVPNQYPETCDNPYDINHQYCVNNFTTLRPHKALHPLYFITPYKSYTTHSLTDYNKRKTILVYTGRIKTPGIMYMMRDIMKKLGNDFELHIFPGRFSIPGFEVSVISPKCPVNLQLLRDLVYYDCTNVIIHMPYDDKNKAKYLLNADIAIDFSPSRPKNQTSIPGNAKLLEYCYFGLKVVCERNINNSHIPVGAKNCILIDNIGTVEDYVEAIRKIVNQPIDKQYAIQYTIENHNWDIISRELIDKLSYV